MNTFAFLRGARRLVHLALGRCCALWRILLSATIPQLLEPFSTMLSTELADFSALRAPTRRCSGGSRRTAPPQAWPLRLARPSCSSSEARSPASPAPAPPCRAPPPTAQHQSQRLRGAAAAPAATSICSREWWVRLLILRKPGRVRCRRAGGPTAEGAWLTGHRSHVLHDVPRSGRSAQSGFSSRVSGLGNQRPE